MTNLDEAEHAASLGAWAIGLIHYPESPRYVPPETAEEIGAALKRRCEVVGVFVNSPLEEVDRGRRAREPDDGPAQRRGGALVLRRGGAADRGQGDQGDPRRQRRRHPGGRGLPDRLPPLRRRGKGLWGGTGESFDWELLREHRSEVPAILAGGLRPENVAEAIAVTQPYAVDVASGVEAEPGRKDHAAMAAFFEAAGVEAASSVIADEHAVEERFGPYGGRYVPETLIAALDELTAAWAEAREDAGLSGRARRAAPRLHRPPDAALPRRAALRAGRAPRLPEARGPRPHRRPQDQQRGRPGAARPADGQAAGDRRDRRRPARRRHRDRLRAARPRVRRLHGHRGHPPPGAQRRADEAARAPRSSPVEAGARTLKEAVSAAIRDWVANVETTHYVIGSAVGPAPYPGAGPRPAAGDRRRGARAGARRRGRAAGAGDRLRRRRLQLDRHLHAVRRRRRGRADRRRGGGRGARERPPRRLAGGRAAPASCTARSPR